MHPSIALFVIFVEKFKALGFTEPEALRIVILELAKAYNEPKH